MDLFRTHAVDLFLPVSSPAAAVWDSAAKVAVEAGERGGAVFKERVFAEIA